MSSSTEISKGLPDSQLTPGLKPKPLLYRSLIPQSISISRGGGGRRAGGATVKEEKKGGESSLRRGERNEEWEGGDRKRDVGRG